MPAGTAAGLLPKILGIAQKSARRARCARMVVMMACDGHSECETVVYQIGDGLERGADLGTMGTYGRAWLPSPNRPGYRTSPADLVAKFRTNEGKTPNRSVPKADAYTAALRAPPSGGKSEVASDGECMYMTTKMRK